MNTPHKFLAFAVTALAMAAGTAQAHEGSYPEVKPMVSTLSRAEVQAQAAQVGPMAHGEVAAAIAPTPTSQLSRAEVKAQVLAASRTHALRNGEAG